MRDRTFRANEVIIRLRGLSSIGCSADYCHIGPSTMLPTCSCAKPRVLVAWNAVFWSANPFCASRFMRMGRWISAPTAKQHYYFSRFMARLYRFVSSVGYVYPMIVFPFFLSHSSQVCLKECISQSRRGGRRSKVVVAVLCRQYGRVQHGWDSATNSCIALVVKCVWTESRIVYLL